MIRDAGRVYGEINDPDTVLAAANLTANQPVVGSGNKGVQSYAPGARRILTTDASGNASSLDHSTPNSFIGTDGSGNLALVAPYTVSYYVPTAVTSAAHTYGAVTATSNTFGGQVPVAPASITLPDFNTNRDNTYPNHFGFTFSHWSTTQGGAPTQANTTTQTLAAISGNTNLYAVYKERTSVTITFRDQGNTTTLQTINCANNTIPQYTGALPTKATTGNDPTYIYRFAGWSTAANQTTGSFNLPRATANTTYYAAFNVATATSTSPSTENVAFQPGASNVTYNTLSGTWPSGGATTTGAGSASSTTTQVGIVDNMTNNPNWGGTCTIVYNGFSFNGGQLDMQLTATAGTSLTSHNVQSITIGGVDYTSSFSVSGATNAASRIASATNLPAGTVVMTILLQGTWTFSGFGMGMILGHRFSRTAVTPGGISVAG